MRFDAIRFDSIRRDAMRCDAMQFDAMRCKHTHVVPVLLAELPHRLGGAARGGAALERDAAQRVAGEEGLSLSRGGDVELGAARCLSNRHSLLVHDAILFVPQVASGSAESRWGGGESEGGRERAREEGRERGRKGGSEGREGGREGGRGRGGDGWGAAQGRNRLVVRR